MYPDGSVIGCMDESPYGTRDEICEEWKRTEMEKGIMPSPGGRIFFGRKGK
ncbi:predicted protein [Sclerotinia sclerotiorum 1980 UF-70]|uniref:Uncharacterized protein n=2 Tax=Sclerotinia sclerotiorum (strain ATCC 18683 / 1980 / Ss-1) TaxID=665079 RepID=A7EL14_SCLS1|nr:predicted protein [Sclerotinia sclerotiorum 1980 UF-70]APA09784.1 hypothetical protein sscle_05g045540 [Sclerotinia sclerotiorum 1980 UF-70]EDO03530.1 predicted protein [Sclerotinia sclerotiorum 1980 UF-70]